MVLSLAAKLELDEGKIVRIMGPANVVVEQGKVRVLGIEFGAGSRFIVHRYRSYAVKAVERCTLSIVLGEGGSIEEPAEGEEVVDSWEAIANEVVESRGIAVVVGPVDSGKTSLSTMIANVALSRGLKVAVIDADIGQGDLAPPGFIALKFYDRPTLWLREFKGDVLRFVGYITPTYPTAAERLISAVRDLVQIARDRGSEVIVVNTDGWISGYSAIEHKLDLVKSVRPTHLLVLDDQLAQRFEIALRRSNVKVVRVPRPKVVRERNRIDRRVLRRQHYQSFFQNAKRICLDLSSLYIVGSCLFSGNTLSPDKVGDIAKALGLEPSYAAELEDLIVVFVEIDRALDSAQLRELVGKDVYIITRSTVKGVLAAVLDGDLNEVAPALIDYMSIAENKICIATEWNGEIRGLMIGRIKLSENWEEVGKPMKCLL